MAHDTDAVSTFGQKKAPFGGAVNRDMHCYAAMTPLAIGHISV